jgi:hypothetical protein
MNKTKITIQSLTDTASREDVVTVITRFYALASVIPENGPWLSAMLPAVVTLTSAVVACPYPGLILNAEAVLRETVLNAVANGEVPPGVIKGSHLYDATFNTEVTDPVNDAARRIDARRMDATATAQPPTKAAYSKAERPPYRDDRRTGYASGYDRPRVDERARQPEPYTPRQHSGTEPCRNFNARRGCSAPYCKYSHVCANGCKPPDNVHADSSTACPKNKPSYADARK